MSSRYQPNLDHEIKKLFRSKEKYQKAINAYSWILSNVPGIEISENGQIISPMKSINILDFLKHIYSENKTFSNDILELYKIWIALIDFPQHFVNNLRIKNYAYSEDDITKSNNLKRKLSFNHI